MLNAPTPHAPATLPFPYSPMLRRGRHAMGILLDKGVPHKFQLPMQYNTIQLTLLNLQYILTCTHQFKLPYYVLKLQICTIILPEKVPPPGFEPTTPRTGRHICRYNEKDNNYSFCRK